ncbi:MAG TPA: MBOAT family O-acyltransferase [Anaerolineales bacterium]|nr:MBOAT family O-acyltransferase [Anaerolineales bacterium]
MSFTTLTFWLFFAVTLALYWLIRERRWQNGILLVASYIFYGWVDAWLAVMLGISTLADFFLARRMETRETPAGRRPFLWLSLIVNLGVLAFFKYYNFFSEDVARVADVLGIQSNFLLTQVLLPAGLSFYTLKKLGYMIDVSRGSLAPAHSLIDFALYVSFFPQIVAGPIDRPQTLLPQIEAQRTWKATYFYSAWHLILMGLFKKLVIANSVGSITERIFNLQDPTLLLAVAGALGFTLQILADFSAYTDLSRGVAYLLGFDTSENFRSPYLSLTPTEFWNRWHITLSFWLRDYVFFPLRRFLLRRGQFPAWMVQAIPPLVTMLISGIWHGAGWTYFLWGGMYGILIVVYQSLGMGGNWRPTSRTQALLAWLVMFSFIVFGWMLFAAPSLDWIVGVFSGPVVGTLEQQAVALIALSITFVYSLPLIVKAIIDRSSNPDSLVRSLYYAGATAMLFIYVNSATPDFIYFQF